MGKTFCKCGNNDLSEFYVRSNIKMLKKHHLSDIEVNIHRISDTKSLIKSVTYDFNLDSDTVELTPTNLVCAVCNNVLTKKRSIEILDEFPMAENIFNEK